MSDFTNSPLPNPERDAIAAIPNPCNRAIALTRYPGLDPHDPAVTEMAAVLTEELIGEWGRELHARLAFLANLDAKALEKQKKKLLKAPVSPMNIWADFPEVEAPIADKAAVIIEVNEATPELV